MTSTLENQPAARQRRPSARSAWRSSARASPASAWPSPCSRRGETDFVVLERARRRRRHLARQHLSRRRLRRAVQPLLVLLRAEPGLAALLLRAAGDPGLPAGHRRPVRRPPALRLRRRRHRRPLGRRRAALAGRHHGRRVPGAASWSPPPAPWPTRPIPTSRAWTPSPARSCTPPAGTTRTTSPASGSPSSAPAPRRSRWCRPSSRSSSSIAVYQRTPAWVVPRTDHPVKPLDADGSTGSCPACRRRVRAALYLFREFLVIGMAKQPALPQAGRQAGPGPPAPPGPRPEAAQAALTPDYTIGCKRILISNDYFPAVAAPNAELVTAGIAEVAAALDRHQGRRRAADRHDRAGHRLPRDRPADRGEDLRPRRAQPGRGLGRRHGQQPQRRPSPGFPNLFLLVGPNVGRRAHVDGLHDRVAGGLRRRRAAHHGRRGPRGAGDDPGGAGGLPRPDRREVEGHRLARRWLRQLVPGQARPQHDAVAGLHLPVPQADQNAGPGELRRRPRRPAERRRWRHERPDRLAPGRRRRHAGRRAAARRRRRSDDAPVTLVLAHGWTLAQAAWDDVAELLAPRVAAGELRLVRYDQRGHGRSTWGRYCRRRRRADHRPARGGPRPSAGRARPDRAGACSAATRWAA